MNNKSENLINSANKKFISDFDEIYGFDIVSFCLNKEQIIGYFYDSPIEQRVVTNFNYKPHNTNVAKKTYRAHWMIYNSKLELGYVNGIINGVHLNTLDIVPEFPNNELLYHYHWYSGQLKLNIQQTESHPIFDPYFINKNELLLKFENGILEKPDTKEKTTNLFIL